MLVPLPQRAFGQPGHQRLELRTGQCHGRAGVVAGHSEFGVWLDRVDSGVSPAP